MPSPENFFDADFLLEDNEKKEGDYKQPLERVSHILMMCSRVYNSDIETLREVKKALDQVDLIELKKVLHEETTGTNMGLILSINRHLSVYIKLIAEKHFVKLDPNFEAEFEDIMCFIKESLVFLLEDFSEDKELLNTFFQKNTDSNQIYLVNEIYEFSNQEIRKQLYSLSHEYGLLKNLDHKNYSVVAVELILEYGTDEEIKCIENLVFNSLVSDLLDEYLDVDKINYIKFLKDLSINSTQLKLTKTVQAAFNRAKEQFLETHGFDLSELTKETRIPLKHWPKTIGVVSAIERKHKGGSKILSSIYGIRCFFRYPSEILIKQLEDENIDNQYGVLVTAYDDHNGAMDFKGERIIKPLQSDLDKGNYKLKITEAGSSVDFMRRLVSLKNKYPNKKISFLIISAHGQKDYFILDPKKTGYGSVKSLDLESTGVGRLQDFFIDKPQIILSSCSTGAEGGIGEKISKRFNAHVFAPIKPTAVTNIQASFDNNEVPLFKIEYSDKDASKEYATE